MTDSASRRAVLRAAGATSVAGVVGLAGCLGGSGGADASGENTVAAGPDGRAVFEPKKLTVSTGTTVTWAFQSVGHNVSAWPDMHEGVAIPNGATGFGSMEQGGDAYASVPKGETFEHTFETTGTFRYVCVPHAASGMVGSVVVED